MAKINDTLELMERKIPGKLRRHLEMNALMNEILILPVACDLGEEEYIRAKAKLIAERKELYSVSSKNVLMLEYPYPKTTPYSTEVVNKSDFDKFFESAAVTADGDVFYGCFAIDISNYTDLFDSEYFEMLLDYIRNNQDAVYCLVLYTPSNKSAANITSLVSKAGLFVETRFEQVEAEALAEYAAAYIRPFAPSFSSEETELLEKFFSQGVYGYDFADYIVNYLKTTAYKGDDVSGLDEVIKRVKEINFGDAGASRYGY